MKVNGHIVEFVHTAVNTNMHLFIDDYHNPTVCPECIEPGILSLDKSLPIQRSSDVKVSVAPVLKLVKYGIEKDKYKFKETALEIAVELIKNNEQELALYIYAAYDLVPTWVPQ